MKFRKLSDLKFQVLLNKEDMTNFNVSLDDLMHYNIKKIRHILDVVMEKAYEHGINMEGIMMSLQLVPQPDQSVMITVSGHNEGGGIMIKRPSGAKNTSFMSKETEEKDPKEDDVLISNIDDRLLFGFDELSDVEDMCSSLGSTSGIDSSLYKGDDGYFYISLKRQTASREKFSGILIKILEYGTLEEVGDLKVLHVTEHMDEVIAEDAIESIKEYAKA